MNVRCYIRWYCRRSDQKFDGDLALVEHHQI